MHRVENNFKDFERFLFSLKARTKLGYSPVSSQKSEPVCSFYCVAHCRPTGRGARSTSHALVGDHAARVAGHVVGIAAFFMPLSTLLALVYLFGAYAFFGGVFNLVAAWRQTSRQKPWWALLLSGIAGIGAAGISFVWPGITALALVYVVSSWALITGGLEIAAAVKLRKEIEGEWLLALSGLLSMVLGFLLAFFPDAGAIGLVWYLGAYAVVFGILMVALGWRLRMRRTQDHSQPSQAAA